MELYNNLSKESDVPIQSEKMKRLLQTGVKIKTKLGENSFLFDRYLTLVVNFTDGLTDDFIKDVLDGIEDVYGIFIDIIEKKLGTQYRNNHLYSCIEPFLKNYIEMHPFTYQDKVFEVSLYYLGLLKELSVNLVDKYIDKHAQQLEREIEELDIKDRYKTLCEMAGKSLMDEFNKQAKAAFYTASIDQCYLQGALSYILCVMRNMEKTGYDMMLRLIEQLMEGKTI